MHNKQLIYGTEYRDGLGGSRVTTERHFANDILKCLFLNENVWISIMISLNLVPRGPINNIPALVQIMSWRRPGDKPLSEPMMVCLLTYICVTRPQRVNKHQFWHKIGEKDLNAPNDFKKSKPAVAHYTQNDNIRLVHFTVRRNQAVLKLVNQ